MKETFVFDSTPLIYLGKAMILKKLNLLHSRNIIPKSVFLEVVIKGKEKGITDAFYVESLAQRMLFEIVEVPLKLSILKENKNLDPADIDVLSLAKTLSARAIIDDEEARNAADIEQITKGGSIYILFRLLLAKAITKKEGRAIVDTMLKAGWRCSTEMYALILQKLEEG